MTVNEMICGLKFSLATNYERKCVHQVNFYRPINAQPITTLHIPTENQHRLSSIFDVLMEPSIGFKRSVTDVIDIRTLQADQ